MNECQFHISRTNFLGFLFDPKNSERLAFKEIFQKNTALAVAVFFLLNFENKFLDEVRKNKSTKNATKLYTETKLIDDKLDDENCIPRHINQWTLTDVFLSKNTKLKFKNEFDTVRSGYVNRLWQIENV